MKRPLSLCVDIITVFVTTLSDVMIVEYKGNYVRTTYEQLAQWVTKFNYLVVVIEVVSVITTLK